MIRDLDIDLLDLRPDARRVEAARVQALAESIADTRLLNPIIVRPRRDAEGRFEVIAGAHRLAAHRLLGLAEIACDLVHDDDLHAELAMIDENLIRAELTAVDRAQAVARRKAIYEELFPEARHGGDRRSDQVANIATRSFADETASLSGQSPRTVRLDAERGARVSAEVFELIRATPLNTGRFLDEIKHLSPAEQLSVARAELSALASRDAERRRARQAAKQAARQQREAALSARQQALPEKRYGVIYADPEWRFEPWSRETGMDRAADNHYPTSGLEAIKARPVADIAAEDCVLFLWATAPMLPQALEVMAAWGFAYKSHCIWNKDRPGTGYWFRNAHELLLVGTRGDVPAPAMGTQFPSVVDHPVLGHSEKPERFAELIEDYFPTLPKIELNARRAREGWEHWGDEVEPAEVSRKSDAGGRAAVDLTAFHTLAATYQPAEPFAWTDAARALLAAGYAASVPASRMAGVLGCSPGALFSQAHRLGLTDPARRGARNDLKGES